MRLNLELLDTKRILSGYSIVDVARRAKLPYQRVAAVFQGRSQSPGTVRAICAALRIRTNEVWGGGG
jgi:hypothetical protein